MRKVQDEGQTDGGWTVVQCKGKEKKVGFIESANKEGRECNELNKRDRECKAFTKTNGIANYRMDRTEVLKGTIHEGDKERDCRELMRERNKNDLRLNG